MSNFWHRHQSNWPHILLLVIGIGIGWFFGVNHGDTQINQSKSIAEKSYMLCLAKTFIPDMLKADSWRISQWHCDNITSK